MRRVLQAASMFCGVIGIALWFFGGMNLGASEWSEDAHLAEPAHAIGEERRHVFRPGIGFLAGTVLLGVALWTASRFAQKGNSGTPG